MAFCGLLACEKAPPRPAGQGQAAAVADELPAAVAAQRRLALVRVDEGQPVDALLAQLQGRAERDPGKLDHWVALGRAWVRKARESGEPGYYRNADACAEVALALQPGSPIALDLRGLVLLNDHQFAAARALAAQVVDKDPRDPLAWGSLSDAALELGHVDEAVDAAQRMMALKPNLPAYSRAAYLFWLRGDTQAAKQAMRQAIDAAPMSRRDPEPRAWALVQAAQIFWHEGDYPGAEAGFRMAEQTFPGYPAALVGLARVHLARGQGKEAAELLQRAYQRSPLCETAWLLGDARHLAGDDKGAEDAYEMAARQGKADPRTLAQMYAALDRHAPEALRLAEEERRVRGDVYTQDAYAFALYRAGRVAEALPVSDGAMKLGTKDARLFFHAGAIRLRGGDAEGGRRLLREALKLNPKFDVHGAAEAARLLASAGQPSSL